ncbi:DNA cytosine methyltransferase [Alkaliphilus transvaalensis]|uniref:DNA cytosine methyltransferase n=1 Tax=Alkaliphilus transvaalensis TaxID=114628 RepID=UPI00047B632A|nr:DNA cytosine methyltransferase [Alkaliphilus transvaalensis]
MGSKVNTTKNTYYALDLFCGAGGFSVGMEQAGINVVASIEFNQQIAETYKYNNPQTHLIIDDIRFVKASKEDMDITVSPNDYAVDSIDQIFTKRELSCDIIFGGPPCQGFSMAGRRIRTNAKFLEDERNYLFKEFIRMVKYLKPKVFIIENVPGILNYNDGSVKREIYETFKALGYNVHADVLCAADYGVPQIRNRAFFIGNNLGLCSTNLFPPTTHNKDTYISVIDAISDLPPLNSGEGVEEIPYPAVGVLTEYQKKLRNPTGIIYNHISSKHKDETISILQMINEGQTMKDLPEEYRTKSVHSGAYGRMRGNAPAYTLTTRLNTPSVGRITHPKQHRTITPREAARIQSFPDEYKFLGDITSLGMQIGNAVPPLLAKSLGKQVVKVLHSLGI